MGASNNISINPARNRVVLRNNLETAAEITIVLESLNADAKTGTKDNPYNNVLNQLFEIINKLMD